MSFRGRARNRNGKMGKASKWIRNYVMGKKEEKHKKNDVFSIDNKTTNMACQMESPKVKRRWSFGKIAGKVAVHKFSRSLDSGDSAKLHVQAMLENQAPNGLPTAFPEVFKDIENITATKIQAAFRSYLARKALHALRGLVKLQALVRGHLVRKQTTATLQGLHALMAIQVRARIHRIQMTREANIILRELSPQPREIQHDKGVIREYKDSKDMSLKEMLEVLKSRSGPLDDSHVKSREHDFMTFHPKQGQQYKENTLITAPNRPEICKATSELAPTKALSTSQRQLLAPNYMTKTESSKAKARSQSEPKQRAKRGMTHKNQPIEPRKELVTSLDGRRQYLSSSSSQYNHGTLKHWVLNFYGSRKDSKFDSFSSSTATSESNH